MGRHLLKTEENEHVEIAEVRGFISDSVLGAMKEIEAISKGTRCKQPIFSVSLSPPAQENVAVEVFEGAIAKIEESLGLQGQPRVVVYHEKEGRRHAHCVFSRIDAETMTARPLSHFGYKLRDIAKSLFIENGWRLPQGYVDSAAHDPRNYTLDQWQKARRLGGDARALKSAVQECWSISDNRAAFAQALEERGLFLAKGDRRGYVVITFDGDIHALSRLTDKREKGVREKLGEPDGVSSVQEMLAHIARDITPRLGGYIKDAKRIAANAMKPLIDEKALMRSRHASEREKLDQGQKERWQSETRVRASRLRGGVKGIWDRLTGEYGRVQRQNQMEAHFALLRDRSQRQAVISGQLAERQQLQEQIALTRTRHARQIVELHRQSARFRSALGKGRSQEMDAIPQAGAARGRIPELGLEL
jgi:hypothetical protein